MGSFISTYTSKLDDRNRLSVPAAFRGLIEAEGATVVYGYCSFINESIEVCTEKRMLEIQDYIEGLDIFSQERDALETAILSGAEPMHIDNKGRIMLSDRLKNFAGINKEAMFVGKGKIFEMWSVDRFNKHYQKAREYAISKGLTLKPRREG